MNPNPQPKVSVIMAAYNVERYIGEAIESIEDQTYQNWELLIGDDGSTDKTIEIAAQYAQKNPRILVHAFSHDGRFSVIRNKLMHMASGSYLAIQDSDDMSLPNRLSEQVGFLEAHSDIVGVSSAVALVSQDGAPLNKIKQRETNETRRRFRLLLQTQYIDGTLLIRKESLLKIGGYRIDAGDVADFDLWNRITAAGMRLANLETVAYLYRQHLHSLTHNQNRIAESRARLLDLVAKNIEPFAVIPLKNIDLLVKYVNYDKLSPRETISAIRWHHFLMKKYTASQHSSPAEIADIRSFYTKTKNDHLKIMIKNILHAF